MEENKQIKISLSTFFLIFATIVIIIMGFFIYRFNSEKSIATQEVANLNNQVSSLESEVNNLQETIDHISNTTNINGEISNSKINNNTGNEESKFSNDEIKKCLQEYLELVGSKEGAPSVLLQKLNLLSTSDIIYTDDNTTNDGYIKTNIQYSKYKEVMMNYMTEEWFNTRFTNGFKNQNGLLYYFNGGASVMEFEVESIAVKGDYSDFSYIANVYNIHLDGSKDLENIEFHVTNYNGKCVITYCD
ncbi:MAG: hypothetical protein HFJ40_04515 [Clostridia bacterium]|nr:hypothetical protein [Clostridia bacterium]